VTKEKYRGAIRELLSAMRKYIRTGKASEYNCITKCFDLIHYDPELTTAKWSRDLQFAKLITRFATEDIANKVGVIPPKGDTDENDPTKNIQNCD